VPASWTTLFEVEDTDATVARVIAAGGTSTPPSDFVYGRIAEVTDPFGARFSIGSGPPHSQG
jgi:predicted enzyme related to lactoylglutathione lyase